MGVLFSDHQASRPPGSTPVWIIESGIAICSFRKLSEVLEKVDELALQTARYLHDVVCNKRVRARCLVRQFHRLRCSVAISIAFCSQ